ncbi:hypothetical protein C1645_824851 [Glomus cerebriforme]|uniref:Uncharacterized protein n=1 Tax=Glomus cerebriforme TaxID=658196 RepID=A0A397STM6_9GLOM|nr:hypothetical protein C1645_824851 [Glomus cerebriforme]
MKGRWDNDDIDNLCVDIFHSLHNLDSKYSSETDENVTKKRKNIGFAPLPTIFSPPVIVFLPTNVVKNILMEYYNKNKPRLLSLEDTKLFSLDDTNIVGYR